MSSYCSSSSSSLPAHEWDDPTEDGMTRRRPASSEPHPATAA